MKNFIYTSIVDFISERLQLGRQERVHISVNEIDSVKDTPQKGLVFGKPDGLWYGFGDSWVNFVKYEFDPETFKTKKWGYKVYPNPDKIITLRTHNDVFDFVNKYLNRNPIRRDEYDIDWNKVSQDYSGIEIPTYSELGMRGWWEEDKMRYFWLYPWDVPSGCVWKSDGVLKIKAL